MSKRETNRLTGQLFEGNFQKNRTSDALEKNQSKENKRNKRKHAVNKLTEGFPEKGNKAK